jgi:prophage antirepressor-like protein
LKTSRFRVIERGGEPWFVLADVCRVLEIGNPRDAAGRLDDDKKDGRKYRRSFWSAWRAQFFIDIADVTSMKEVEAQDARHVLADARRGIADELRAARIDIVEAADEVVDTALGVEEQRVYREIAALRVRRRS